MLNMYILETLKLSTIDQSMKFIDQMGGVVIDSPKNWTT